MSEFKVKENVCSKIRNVCLITDCRDVAYNEMHQILINEMRRHNLNDIHISPMVGVSNFSVTNASFMIRLMAEVFPHEETLFVVVVHGIQSNPERILGTTKSGLTFVGNNSGYFNWLLEDYGLEKLYENKTSRLIDGKSFGGKYVQIPTSIKLLLGVSMENLGEKRQGDFLSSFKIEEGTVVHSDNFGLMKIKADKLDSLQEGDSVQIFLNGIPKVKAIYTEKMKRQKDGKWVLFTGSSLYGLPELGKVRSPHSAQELGVCEGDIIRWEKV